jgi:hypothetical protein
MKTQGRGACFRTGITAAASVPAPPRSKAFGFSAAPLWGFYSGRRAAQVKTFAQVTNTVAVIERRAYAIFFASRPLAGRLCSAPPRSSLAALCVEFCGAEGECHPHTTSPLPQNSLKTCCVSSKSSAAPLWGFYPGRRAAQVKTFARITSTVAVIERRAYAIFFASRPLAGRLCSAPPAK